jgi:ketosteroid isomerase-like protein
VADAGVIDDAAGDARPQRGRGRRVALLVLVVIAICTSGVALNGRWFDGDAVTSSPEQAVEAFHDALRNGNAAMALSMLAPDATVFELGQADASRRDYAAVHLSNDMRLAARARRELLARQRGETGDARWITSAYRWVEQGEDAKPPTTLAETVILRRAGDRWQIVHFHWSFDASQPVVP